MPATTAVYLPVHGVMSAITDVYSDLAVCCLKHWMSGVALQVVCALIEVTYTRDVVLHKHEYKQHSC